MRAEKRNEDRRGQLTSGNGYKQSLNPAYPRNAPQTPHIQSPWNHQLAVTQSGLVLGWHKDIHIGQNSELHMDSIRARLADVCLGELYTGIVQHV